ncbi:putative leucine-rich repeat receptor-like protein kinase [Camellia lanceoleosa]|uniref:Leucine-rich repeat receptor-like protein kinase n=1 Tax=Camellia lanceoleosa TaxID=1840588 RepID=A0ACC0FCY6_9ERIC|nr:putative leucine-rich repeat receptor-like protein kinase [Camellia lanceoleosa]
MARTATFQHHSRHSPKACRTTPSSSLKLAPLQPWQIETVLVKSTPSTEPKPAHHWWRTSHKEEPDAETITSMLGFQSYWDATYVDELANFHEHGHTGEVWLLDSNQLSGNIPLTLGSILNLEALNLLSGSVPSNLNNLVNVRELFLSNNQLSGSLPSLMGMATLNYM